MNDEEHVAVSATTKHLNAHPGSTGLLAITLDMEDKWHTYWPGVSDSGYGTTLDISVPDSITLDDPIWPTPQRYLQPGDILDHVYEDTATVLVPYKVNDDAQVGDILIFEINADYLVCKDLCLPGKGKATTTVAVVEQSTLPAQSSAHNEIERAWKARPVRFDPSDQDVRVQWIDSGVGLIFRDATKIEFFPSTRCSELLDPIKGGTSDSNPMLIKFKNSEEMFLDGRVRVHRRIGNIDYDVSLRAGDS
jgi:DsbC/DsbD-like thiol-disulfide interchange protein